jgi:hypothetical protein
MDNKSLTRDILLVLIPTIITAIASYYFNERQVETTFESLSLTIKADRENNLLQINENAKETELDRSEARRQFEISLENSKKLFLEQSIANKHLIVEQITAARETMSESIEKSFQKEKLLQRTRTDIELKETRYKIMNEAILFQSKLLAHENTKQTQTFTATANLEYFYASQEVFPKRDNHDIENFPYETKEVRDEYLLSYHEIDAIVLLGKIGAYFSVETGQKFSELYDRYLKSNGRNLAEYDDYRIGLRELFISYLKKQKDFLDMNRNKNVIANYLNINNEQLQRDILKKRKNFVSKEADTQNVLDEIIILQSYMLKDVNDSVSI